MLLKRSIVLAAGVLLFIVAFIIYFQVSDAQMENRFRTEREKFNVDHLNLTASGPATMEAPASPAPASASDTNTPISPVPPASPATPESTPAPAAPAAPDTNSAPATPSPSTIDYRRTSHSPFFVLASYHPMDSAAIPMAGMVTGQVTAAAVTPVTSPATNAAASPAPSGTAKSESAIAPATQTVPSAPATNTPGVAHPSPVEGSVIVLLYHQFRPAGVPIPPMYHWTMHQDVFEAEMKYLHDNNYHVVPLSDVVRFLKHEITLPPGSVCITIDDGYKSAIDYAAPILKKYGYPWTFFIYPEFITIAEGPGAASWKDLLALQADGVDIESHSMTHPKLTSHHQLIKKVWHNFSPEEYAAWLTNETAGSKALLEQKMGKPIPCFAYPFGDYNKQVEAAVIAAGYEAILTVAGNPVHSTTSLHSIGRYTITREEEKNFATDLREGALGLGDPEPAPGTTISNPRPVISAVLGYAGTLDPKSIETSVYDFEVRHDFDPQTNTVRLYLPRDLIQAVVPVYIRVKDTASGQVMVAKWHFNYEPVGGAVTPVHTPIAPTTNASAPTSKTTAATTTKAPATTEPEPLEKAAVGTPIDVHPAAPLSPH